CSGLRATRCRSSGFRTRPRPRSSLASAAKRSVRPPQLPSATDDGRSCSILLAPQLFEPRIAAAVEAVEFIADRILHVVILMVLFGLVERSGRHDLGRDRLLEALLDRRLRGLRQRPLFLAAIEDRAAILVAVVAELTILRQRIDVVPEHVEQLVIAHLGRIVHDLHRFGVTGAAVRNLFVAGVDGVPASVAGGGANYAVDLVEIGLHAPEAAAGEGGNGGSLRLAPPSPAALASSPRETSTLSAIAPPMALIWRRMAVLPNWRKRMLHNDIYGILPSPAQPIRLTFVR